MNLYHDRAGSVRVTLATPTPRGLALALSNGQWELNSFRAHWSGRSLGYSGRRPSLVGWRPEERWQHDLQ